MKKVFLDELPMRQGGTINWQKSVGIIVNFIYDDIKGEILIKEVIGKRSRLLIEYNNKEFEIESTAFKNGRLGKLLGKVTNEFKVEIGQIFKDKKRDIVIIDRQNKINKKNHNLKYYKYKCNKCGFGSERHYDLKDNKHKEELWIEESNLLHHKKGCSCCCTSPQIVVEGINDIPTTTPWMIKYFQGGIDEAKLYTCNSAKSIYLKCPDCGRVKDKSMVISTFCNTRSISCICNDGFSYPTKLMFSLLEQLEIKFITEYSPEWCKYIDFNDINKIKTGRYDFKLKDYPFIIEVDGEWHKIDNTMSGQTKEESQYIDFTKDKLAKEYGIKVIRIDCDYKSIKYRFKNIKNNILNSELGTLFDLSKIDWLKVNMNSQKNIIKEICIYVESKQNNIICTKVCDLFSIDVTTLNKYLKIGNEIGWCHYIFDGNRKRIGIYKDNEIVGIFQSIHELDRKSEELFGVKLLYPNISSACRGKLDKYKNFTFNFLNEKGEIINE